MPIREPIVVFDIETIPDADHHVGDAFPKSLFHKIAAISYLKANSVQGEAGSYFAVEILRSGGTVESPEEQLVGGFFQFIEKSKPRLVTFNGRGFDLPVLKYRALLHKVSAPWYARGESKWENYSQRYSVEWHCDLMDALSEFGATKACSLKEICGLLGFPGKIGIDGSQVAEYVATGRIAEVRDYCETDVLSTYLVFLRYALFRGELTMGGYETSAF
jgi:3'-5' exonuclease